MAHEKSFTILKTEVEAVKTYCVTNNLDIACLNVYNTSEDVITTSTGYELTGGEPTAYVNQKVVEVPVTGTNGLTAIIADIGVETSAIILAKNTNQNVLTASGTILYFKIGGDLKNDYPEREDD